jgi:hypothetical protein
MGGTVADGTYKALDKRGCRLAAGLTNALHGMI